MPLLAKEVSAKNLPGHCDGDLLMSGQLVSRLPLPLPEMIPMLKTSHHDDTQFSVG